MTPVGQSGGGVANETNNNATKEPNYDEFGLKSPFPLIGKLSGRFLCYLSIVARVEWKV